jgi:hypothetical protein
MYQRRCHELVRRQQLCVQARAASPRPRVHTAPGATLYASSRSALGRDSARVLAVGDGTSRRAVVRGVDVGLSKICGLRRWRSFSECDKPRTQHGDCRAQWAGAAGARGGGACLPRARWLCRRACRPAPCTRGAGRERAAGRCGAGGPAPAAGRGLGRAPRTARLRCRHERRCAPDRPCTSCRWAHGALAPADSPGEGERAGE